MELWDNKNERLMFLSVKQDIKMWRLGYITVHDGKYRNWLKMDEITPLYQTERVPNESWGSKNKEMKEEMAKNIGVVKQFDTKELLDLIADQKE